MVSFRTVLGDLLVRIPGSMGAMFLDHQGEAVEIVEQPLTSYHMNIIGAYQGIYLDQIRRICEAYTLGALERFKIDCNGSVLLSWVLDDGYYVVIVVEKTTNEALAWRELGKCREILLQDIL